MSAAQVKNGGNAKIPNDPGPELDPELLEYLAKPHMLFAMEASSESVELAVWDGDAAMYLARIESPNIVRAVMPIGGQAPLHASCVGKALLSGLDPAAAGRRVKDMRFTVFTPLTIANGVSLLEDLACARRRGFTFDNGEWIEELRGVAAPIYNEAAHPVAAISISGPGTRFSVHDVNSRGKLVAELAGKISFEIGGRQPDLQRLR